jgi:acyl CoA:acetate/3-ketoacid CoA transferase alpha subunit
MWEKIKKWFGFADLNEDSRLTAEDIELAKAIAEARIKDINEEINERVERIEEEEVADVIEAAKKTVAQVDDIVEAAQGKPRKGRKKKV